jgi:hypothetical protein
MGRWSPHADDRGACATSKVVPSFTSSSRNRAVVLASLRFCALARTRTIVGKFVREFKTFRSGIEFHWQRTCERVDVLRSLSMIVPSIPYAFFRDAEEKGNSILTVLGQDPNSSIDCSRRTRTMSALYYYDQEFREHFYMQFLDLSMSAASDVVLMKVNNII